MVPGKRTYKGHFGCHSNSTCSGMGGRKYLRHVRDTSCVATCGINGTCWMSRQLGAPEGNIQLLGALIGYFTPFRALYRYKMHLSAVIRAFAPWKLLRSDLMGTATRRPTRLLAIQTRAPSSSASALLQAHCRSVKVFPCAFHVHICAPIPHSFGLIVALVSSTLCSKAFLTTLRRATGA